MTQPMEGQVYKASDGNWYRWPDPTPYESEEAAQAVFEEAAEELPPPPPPRPQPTGDLLPHWATPLDSADDRSVWWKQRRAHVAAGVVLAVLAVLGAVAVAGGGDKVPTLRAPETNTIRGTFTLTDSDGYSGSSSCSGDGGYGDVEAGLKVDVRDESQTLLGTGNLTSGVEMSDGCTFRFVVNEVPKAKFYTIEVGRRGDLSYSHDEMEARGWSVSFTLG